MQGSGPVVSPQRRYALLRARFRARGARRRIADGLALPGPAPRRLLALRPASRRRAGACRVAGGDGRGAGARRGRGDRGQRRLAPRSGLPGDVRDRPRRRPQRGRHRRDRPRDGGATSARPAADGGRRGRAAGGMGGQAVGGGVRGAGGGRTGAPAADRRRRRPQPVQSAAAGVEGAGRGPRSGVAHGAARATHALGEAADPGVRLLLPAALSVPARQPSRGADGGRGGRLHAGARSGAGGGRRRRGDPRRA